jgi:hypothetical protein
VTNGLKILAESLIIRKIQHIVINYINLFVFDDEIEMKNRSTIHRGRSRGRHAPPLKLEKI